MLFQSTHPLRGATRHGGVCGQVFQISIHAPLAGCDYRVRNFPFAPRISIHAPLAGCDSSLYLLFQPRRFQSTHPLRGATRSHPAQEAAKMNFNPRTPCGVRRQFHHLARRGDKISIHAPLAGCDCTGHRNTAAFRLISIHAPLAGCDGRSGAAAGFAKISIHAPLAGCDSMASRLYPRS